MSLGCATPSETPNFSLHNLSITIIISYGILLGAASQFPIRKLNRFECFTARRRLRCAVNCMWIAISLRPNTISTLRMDHIGVIQHYWKDFALLKWAWLDRSMVATGLPILVYSRSWLRPARFNSPHQTETSSAGEGAGLLPTCLNWLKANRLPLPFTV